MEALNNELERSKVKLENLQDENLTLQEQISTLENEKALQSQNIEELRNEIAEQKSLIDQLQRYLEAAREMGANSTQGQSSLIGKEGSLYHMDRSAQWSEAPGQITGELIKMEEVNVSVHNVAILYPFSHTHHKPICSNAHTHTPPPPPPPPPTHTHTRVFWPRVLV